MQVKPYERAMLHRNEAQVLEAMVDGVVMIDGQVRACTMIFICREHAQVYTVYRQHVQLI